MAKGVEDTAFYRYARLLALCDVGGDPSRFSIGVDAFHAGNAARAERFPLHLLVQPDARHEALGRRARADRRAGGDGGRVGGARAPLARAVRAAARGRRARRDRGVHDLPDARRRLADRARAALRVHVQGDARGQAQHELGRAGRRLGGARARPTAAGSTSTPAFRADFEPFAAARRRRGRAARAAPDGAQADRARACPTSTRATSWWRSRSSTPTTAARSTGRARRALLGAPPTDPDTRKLWLIRELLALRARRPDAFARRLHAARGGPRRGRVPARRGRRGRAAGSRRRGRLHAAAGRLGTGARPVDRGDHGARAGLSAGRTVTRSRSTSLLAKPLRFQGGSTGWTFPAASVAREQITWLPGAGESQA